MNKIEPCTLSEITIKGWYMYVDFDQQVTKDGWGSVYGGSFYQFDPNDDFPWRNERGCGDVTVFDKDALFIGPINMEKFKK